jgi:hypothetical protein
MKLLKTLLINILLLSACSPKTIYFTQNTRTKIESNKIDLKDIQYYNSHEIILQRNLSYEETKVASGKISIENGEFVEIITLKKKTPGVCESYTSNSLDVSFEKGENRKLRFIMNPEKNYQVSAIEWKNKFGKVSYDTLTYYIKPGGEKALLKVKKDNVFIYDKKERVIEGRTVTSNSTQKKKD